MPEKMGNPSTPKAPKGTSDNATAFPPNVEPRGRKRFGPPTRPEPAPVENIYNTDPHGTAKPWLKGR